MPVKKARYSEGSRYSFYLKKGTSSKLIVFFNGGGASWNMETAANPISLWGMLRKKDGYYFPKSGRWVELLNGGILKANNPKNPFNDWNIILFPYGTGDFHVGDNKFAYTDTKGRNRTLFHYGARNIASSLEVAKNIFDPPSQLLVAGESAGAFGCVAQAHHVIESLPKCKDITIFTDSGHLCSSLWKEIVRDVWHAEDPLWECIQSRSLMHDWTRLLSHQLGPNVKFLNYCSYHDEILTPFTQKLNDSPYHIDDDAIKDFHQNLVQTVTTLKEELPEYYYFISALEQKGPFDQTIHTAARYKHFYTNNATGVCLADWLDDAINKKKYYDVGSNLLYT